MAGVDFDDLKARISVIDVCSWLGIQVNRELRGPCQFCGDPRTFKLTLKKVVKGKVQDLFGCFKCKRHGSILDLVMLVNRVSVHEAGKILLEQFPGTVQSQPVRNSTVPAAGNSTVPPATASQALKPVPTFEGLSTVHEVIDLLGLSRVVCEAVGIGYCKKGLMAARIVFPIRLSSGELLGYIGLATKPDQEPLLKFPSNLDARVAAAAVPLEDEPASQPASDMRKLLRVVS